MRGSTKRAFSPGRQARDSRLYCKQPQRLESRARRRAGICPFRTITVIWLVLLSFLRQYGLFFYWTRVQRRPSWPIWTQRHVRICVKRWQYHINILEYFFSTRIHNIIKINSSLKKKIHNDKQINKLSLYLLTYFTVMTILKRKNRQDKKKNCI